MLIAPGGHLLEDGVQVFAFLGEGVFGTRGDFSEALFGNNAPGFQVIKALRKGTRIDTANRLFQFAEAFLPFKQVAQDQCGPFIADNSHCGRDTAGFWFEW